MAEEEGIKALIIGQILKDTVNKYKAFRKQSDAEGRTDNAVSGRRCMVKPCNPYHMMMRNL